MKDFTSLPCSSSAAEIRRSVSSEGQAASAQSVIADTIHIRSLLSDTHCHCHISDTTFPAGGTTSARLPGRGITTSYVTLREMSFHTRKHLMASSFSDVFIYLSCLFTAFILLGSVIASGHALTSILSIALRIVWQ